MEKRSPEMKAGCPFPNSPPDFGSGILRPGPELRQQDTDFCPAFMLLPQ
jgi:hypothetical protein